MDHGCDIFSNIFTAYNLSRLLLVGNKSSWSFCVFFGLLLGFYMMTYEEYRIGEMYLPAINGTVEGNFAIFILGVIISITGQDWIKIMIVDRWFLTVGRLFGLIVALGGISTIYNLYLHTYQKKGSKDIIKNFLDGLIFYNAIIIPIIYIYYKSFFYQDYNWTILLNSVLLFARVTIDVQVKIITLDTIDCNFMFIFTNVLFIISIFISSSKINLYLLCGLAAAQFSELSLFIYFRANEITDYLGIKIFKISHMKKI